MDIDHQVKRLIDKVASGEMNKFIPQLDNSDFGIFISACAEGHNVRPMKAGYSQVERNLQISIEADRARNDEENFVVGWMGRIEAGGHGGTQCRGAHNSCHMHCPPASHGAGPKNCIGHPPSTAPGKPNDLDAPELKYDLAVRELASKQHVLDALARDGFGLALLHGHSSRFTFTKLPAGYVSVVSNGFTSFRNEVELRDDPAFVPNTWRCLDGEFKVAGGFSLSP